MIDFQLYIEDNKVDLFKDETLQISDKIQDIKDISKIYTTYSSQFNLPATNKNNNIFRHYYNYDIVNGYDARIKKEAVIKINGVDKYRGYIQLNSVNLKDNLPNRYKVFFTGQTAKLKEIIKDQKLQDLSYLSQYDHEYNTTNILNGIQTGLFGGKIKYPLISAEARLTSAINGDLLRVDSDNLITTQKAILNEDFKPAIQVYEIFKAIEAQYDSINFESDFFESQRFKDMYMWLHRSSGRATVSFASFVYNRDNFIFQGNGDPKNYPIDGIFRIIDDRDNINPVIPNDPIDIPTYDTINLSYTITVNGEFEYEIYDALSGNTIRSGDGDDSNPETVNLVLEQQGIYKPEVRVTTEDEDVTTLAVQIDIECIDDYVDQSDGIRKQIIEISQWSRSFNAVSNFIIQDQIPKIKVIDFLTSIFKMYNLTAYVLPNDKIKIMPLEDYYNNGSVYDITKSIDISRSNIKRVDTFYQLDFEFLKPKTIYRKQFSENAGRVYADLNYSIVDELASINDLASTQSYSVKVDFNKMFYVNLLDVDGVSEGHKYGACVNENGEPTSLDATLMFLIPKTKRSGSYDVQSTTGGNSSFSNFFEPSNDIETGVRETETINFGIESENRVETQITLFDGYYSNYIRRNFNRQSRLYNVTAYLDWDFILNYKLNDVVIINNRRYRINEITINLNNRKADLVLQNEVL